MAVSSKIVVGLVGNPNTGKSTLFNALTGMRQHVGNYAGVTVEMKIGSARIGTTDLEVIDLPGTYSLAPRSPDEMVSVDLLLGHIDGQPRPNVILNIADASNLERHLYLTTQLMQLGLPVVVAVNLIDVAKSHGITIDYQQLGERLGVPVIPVQANRGIGLDELQQAIVRSAQSPAPTNGPQLPEVFRAEVDRLHQQLGGNVEPFLIARLLLDIDGHAQKLMLKRFGDSLLNDVQATRLRLAEAGCPIPAVEAKTRFGWVRQTTAGLVHRPATRPPTASDRLDRVLTHKVWGTLIFLLLMFAAFEAIFVGAKPLMGLIDSGREWLADLVSSAMSPGPLRNLLTDGVIKGVGSVLVFLPQIMILFALIAVLEDCGYMSRAAFLMDKLMSKCGLNGKSFIPMLSSVACAVPGIMATRVIENRRDRLATIMVAPLMSCSARLPLYMLLIGTFFSSTWWLPGVMLFAMYLIGLVTAPLVALALKRTLLRGETPVFVMEMPAFKVPQIRTIVRRMIDAGWAFVYRAGTMILASMILIWAVLYFPTHREQGPAFDTATEELREAVEKAEGEEKEQKQKELDTLYGEWKRQSYLGQLGQWMEPVFEPLGWDWKIGMSALASFPAREVIVGTLGIVYNEGDVDPKEIQEAGSPGDTPLGKTIQEEWGNHPKFGKYRGPVALSLLVFFALCCQCVSTLAVIRRETRSWAWPVFTFVYMTTLAYLGALATFQIGRLIVG